MNLIKRLRRKKKSSDVAEAVASLLRVHNIPATISRIRKTLSSHPDYPSLLSIAESLPDWGVETEGVKGTVDDLSEADYPGIAHLKNDEYVVLENIQDKQVTIVSPGNERQDLSLDEFSKIWSGIILRTSPRDGAGEKDYHLDRKDDLLTALRHNLVRFGLPVLFILAFFFGLKQAGVGSLPLCLGFAKIIGLCVCAVLAAGRLVEGNIHQKFCPRGKVINCQRVINSPAGKIFGVSLSDVGLLYFAGGFLALLISLYTANVEFSLFLLGVLNLLALPYTVFSIAYQAYVVRSWCLLCLCVQAVLWLEFCFLHRVVFQSSDSITWSFPSPLFLGFGFAVLTWLALWPLLMKAKKSEYLEAEVKRLRRQPDYIQAQLAKSEQADMSRFPYEVEVGPPDAKTVFTIVTNPLCRYCWREFKEIESLIEAGKGNIKFVIRFLVWMDEDIMTGTEKFLDYEVALRIILMVKNGDHERLHQALVDWFSEDQDFSKKRFEKWQQKYPIGYKSSQKEAEDLLKRQSEWAVRSKINGTPTIFLNDRRLPPGLQLSDLKYFLIRQSG